MREAASAAAAARWRRQRARQPQLAGGDGQCVRTQRGGVEAGRREAGGVERGDRGSSVGAASWVVLTRGGGGVAAGGEGEGEREGEGQGPVGRLPSWAGPPAVTLGFFLFFIFRI